MNSPLITELNQIISDQDNLEPTKEVSEEEIYEAVSQQSKFKAPGPDGFGAGFYQDFQDIVKDDVIGAIQAFFHSGKLLKEIKHTFITLIPKRGNAQIVNHF